MATTFTTETGSVFNITKIPALKRTKRFKPKVYSYVRISTKYRQAKGRGIRRQDDGSLKWCDEHGHLLEPTNCFTDKGMSAFKKRNNAEHGELRVIIDLIDNGQIEAGSILLIESLDRMSRQDVNIAQEILLSIINRGVTVVTLVDGSVYRTGGKPQDMFAQLLFSLAIFMRANDESRQKSDRKSDSWKHKRLLAKDGEYHGGQTPQWIEVVNGKYRVIEAVAQKVCDIFNDYAHNGMGGYRLTAKYGVPQATIGTWLDNPTVIGTLTVTENGVKVLYPKHYPAIVDPKVYELAQQRRAQRYVKRKTSKIGTYTNLFAGMLTDPHGKRMIVQQHNGGTKAFTSPGFVIRCEFLEKAIVLDHMASEMERVTEVKPAIPTNEAAIAKIDADLKKIQTTMMEEPGLAATLLPVLRSLQQRKNDLAGQPIVVKEKVSQNELINLFDAGTCSHEDRMRLRDLVQQSIAAVSITKVEKEGQLMMVHGICQKASGVKVVFRYAYHTRRPSRYVMCDGTDHDIRKRAWMRGFEGSLPNALNTKVIDDDVRRVLNHGGPIHYDRKTISVKKKRESSAFR